MLTGVPGLRFRDLVTTTMSNKALTYSGAVKSAHRLLAMLDIQRRIEDREEAKQRRVDVVPF